MSSNKRDIYKLKNLVDIITADFYTDGFKGEQRYGDTLVLSPKTLFFISVTGNLRAKIESERKLETHTYARAIMNDREVPALFGFQNLVSKKDGTYIFETRYISDSDTPLSLDCLRAIPENIRKNFLREVPQGIHELADKLVGNEKDSRRILQGFYHFVRQHEKPKNKTCGKPIEQLLNEYQNKGCFYGNCKEARTFFMALCDAKGYPSKGVCGKTLESGAHVWVDVFVPVEGGYKLLPVDAALGYFGKQDPAEHLFFEYSPDMPIGLFLTCWNMIKGKNTPNSYKLKIEKI